MKRAYKHTPNFIYISEIILAFIATEAAVLLSCAFRQALLPMLNGEVTVVKMFVASAKTRCNVNYINTRCCAHISVPSSSAESLSTACPSLSCLPSMSSPPPLLSSISILCFPCAFSQHTHPFQVIVAGEHDARVSPRPLILQRLSSIKRRSFFRFSPLAEEMSCSRTSRSCRREFQNS